MTIKRPQLLSTGAALRHAEQQGLKRDDIAKVEIDGVKVDVTAARAALQEAERAAAAAARQKAEGARAADENPGLLRRAKAAVGGTVASVTGALKKAAAPTMRFIEANAPIVNRASETLGAMTKDAVVATPEDVARTAQVAITLKRGGTITIPVYVVDQLTASILKATSVAAGGAAQLPVFGNLVQGGTGLVCALASGASYVLGDADLARSLGGMAKKHVVLGVVGFMPGVGHVASGAQVARDVVRFNEGVPLDQLVQTPQLPAQTAPI